MKKIIIANIKYNLTSLDAYQYMRNGYVGYCEEFPNREFTWEKACYITSQSYQAKLKRNRKKYRELDEKIGNAKWRIVWE